MPGTADPATTPSTSAAPAISPPTRTRLRRPCRASSPNHAVRRCWRARRSNSTNAATAAANRAVAQARPGAGATIEVNRNTAAAGTSASNGAWRRNAAQSDRKAVAHTARNEATTNPGSEGAGATTSPNAREASPRSAPTALAVPSVGRP